MTRTSCGRSREKGQRICYPAVSHGRHGGRFFSAGANFVIIFSGIFLILGIACMVEIGQFFIPERALILKNRRLHIHPRPPDDPFS